MTHPSKVNLKEYTLLYGSGYDYSWSSAKGWLVMPPVSEVELVETVGNSIQFCAFQCHASGKDGGRYEMDTQDCYCFQDLTQACLEPCAGLRNNAVEFASRPSSDFEMCEKSVCDHYSEENEEFCSDPQMKWDPEGCAHKLGHAAFLTTTSSTAPINVTPAVTRTVVEPTTSASTSTTTASTSTRKTTKKKEKKKASKRSKSKRSKNHLRI